MKKDLSSATAAILGSLPGFTLPFVAALVLAPGDSDLLLLALSVGITQCRSSSSAAVELTTIAEYGRVLGRDQNPARDSLRVFRRRVLRFALLLTVLVVPALGRGLRGAAPRTAASSSCSSAAVAADSRSSPRWAAVLSGECIARGGPVVPIAVQSMRSLLPAVLLLAWPDAPLVLDRGDAAGRGGGPGGASWLWPLDGCARGRPARRAGELVADGLVAQALSSGVTQLGPAVDRLYLSSPGAGLHLELRDVRPVDVCGVPVLQHDVHLPAGGRVGAAADDGRRRCEGAAASGRARLSG